MKEITWLWECCYLPGCTLLSWQNEWSIAVQKKPTAFLIKLWPHFWNLLQWPLHHLYIEFTVHCFSFMHICLVNHSLLYKKTGQHFFILNFCKLLGPQWWFCSSFHALMFCFKIVLKLPRIVIGVDWCDKLRWNFLLKLWACAHFSYPWDCTEQTL